MSVRPADDDSPVGRALPATFEEALAALSDDALAALLRQRPDAAVPPPSDFGVLASRLSSQHSVSRVAETVDRFVLQILEALVLGSADEGELSQFCQVPLADIERATELAVTLGLAWRDDEGRLTPVRGVRTAVGQYPLGLGRPFAQLITEVPHNVRAQLQADLGLLPETPDGTPGSSAAKVTATQALTDFFADADALFHVLNGLPEPQQALLTALSVGPPVGEIDGRLRFVPLAEAETSVEKLLARGLLIAIASDAVEQPREVGLAIRGDRPAGEVNPRPRDVAGREVGVKQVDGAGAAAGMDALRLFEALLERWDATPPTLTRAGGLPVREVKAVSKELAVGPEIVALLVQVLSAASLVGRTAGTEPVIVPTERYDRWRDSSLADRWSLLATAWAGMDQLPGLAVHDDGTKAAALLTYDMTRPGAGELRRDVLGAMAAAGPGRAADPEGLRNGSAGGRPPAA